MKLFQSKVFMSNENNDTKRDTLEKFSSNIQQYLRKNDACGRTGERNVTVLPHNAMQETVSTAQRVEQRLKLQRSHNRSKITKRLEQEQKSA